MIDATLMVCTELCQGMLNDYHRDIEQAISKLPDEGGELSISMNFRISPRDSITNEVTASISFAKERVKDKRTRSAHEGQVEMKFENGKTAAAGG